MLGKVLSKFKQEGGHNIREREFMEKFLALAYFRIPSYRNRILKSLMDLIRDQRIEGWQFSDYDINTV